MATNTVIKTRIQFRRATTAEWLANKDTVPYAGEPCFDLDLKTLKIGDGIATYENLNAIGGVDVSADGKTITLTDGTFKLFGFDAAEIGAQPRKNADGVLEWVVPSTETLDGLQTIVAGLQKDVTKLQTDVTSIQEILTPSAEDEVPLLDRIADLEEKITGTGEGSVDQKISDEVTTQLNDFMTKVSDDDTVNTMKELIDYVAAHGSETANMAADITALQTGKVDVVEGKSLVDDTLISKLEAMEDGAQVNKIEAIKLGDTLLEIVDKTVTIPAYAGLQASDEVTIGADGVLGIGQISVSKLVQDDGVELVLDGGAAG